MNTISCDLCALEFDKGPEITLRNMNTEYEGFTVLSEYHIADIHLHHWCFLALGLIPYRDAAEKAGAAPA